MSAAQLQADQLGEIRNLWISLEPHQRVGLLGVAREIGKLGPVACEVLSHQGARLAVGASAYGDFQDNRNWLKESLEEALDQTVYLTMAIKRLEKQSSQESAA